MIQIRQILRLYNQEAGTKKISLYLGLSRNTVRKYINISKSYRLTPEDILKLEWDTLQHMFYV